MTHRLFVRLALVSVLAATSGVSAEAAKRHGAKQTRSHARTVVAAKPPRAKAAVRRPQPSERECLARAMYFESNRNAEDGMLAVGTVVANRLDAGRYGDTLCRVVSAWRQFAPGVLTRPMAEPRPKERALKVADLVLAGARHPVAGNALFFHTANVPFRRDDKRYLLVSGGNAFYAWRRGQEEGLKRENLATFALASANADRDVAAGAQAIAAKLTPRAPTLVADASRPAPEPVASEKAEASLALALAYRGETPPTAARPAAAREALATLASLPPAGAPRVITLAAPVLAAAVPGAPAEPAPALKALLARANLMVAQAWDVFG
ncbi:cell wall hydrolase [Methylopila sp. Yamaguchi]|uniref:cell wall hydrolase n=1 Tax=Methylopila sp. Yamaguchi TaxID=1437817 RepID=UPI000CACDF8E|nr:cell wall hydrolase [Methylopila sp. Yamaguchi]GBD47645.1 hypothetical protein METY_0858 [Methylopila sp. Yamaguchi]